MYPIFICVLRAGWNSGLSTLLTKLSLKSFGLEFKTLFSVKEGLGKEDVSAKIFQRAHLFGSQGACLLDLCSWGPGPLWAANRTQASHGVGKCSTTELCS